MKIKSCLFLSHGILFIKHSAHAQFVFLYAARYPVCLKHTSNKNIIQINSFAESVYTANANAAGQKRTATAASKTTTTAPTQRAGAEYTHSAR